ncbi:MAG: type II restriction endonuclease, partial [Candidatus Binatia bacterium]
SRITLLTGNTYFSDPAKKYPSVRRAYGEYAFNLDWVILFSIDQTAESPEVKELENVVSETWQIASKFRSSTTRKYIGAVDAIANLKAKRGAFVSKAEFETYWRSFDWSKNATPEEIEAEAESEVDDG